MISRVFFSWTFLNFVTRCAWRFRVSGTRIRHYVQVRHFDACAIGTNSEEDEEEQRWNEDPFSGRLSVVDSAFSTLPPHLIDKHWNWVTILDLSRNHIE